MDIISFYMFKALIVVALLIVISSIDEFFTDLVYIFYTVRRTLKMRRLSYTPISYDEILAFKEKRLALMVPCWHEESVIGNMVKHNVPSIKYKEYDIFVGVYPNDQASIDAVQQVEKYFPNVHCVIADHPGPTTKSDNLNGVFKYIKEYEKKHNLHYEVFVFHDSEDVIHPLSFKFYGHLIPRMDMIQVPVFPLSAVNVTYATYWTYADEFAENHTKRMVVREAIRGLVPSAGVGTAFSRKALDMLAERNDGKPFNVNTFTEDYSVALQVHLLKLKTIFLNYRIRRIYMRKRWWIFGREIPVKTYEILATRALFPMFYLNAVRQRSRWITGIVFQEWKITGWVGDWPTLYCLFQDRKGIVTPFLNLAAYILFSYWFLYWLFNDRPSLQSLLNESKLAYWLIVLSTILMVIRLLQRAYAVNKVYGPLPAFFSIPRSVYSNLINLHALLRAYKGILFTRGKLTWDKTNNVFPSAESLKSYKRQLGEILLENNSITTKQLNTALAKQAKLKTRLGRTLIDLGFATRQQILEGLAKQNNLDYPDESTFRVLSKKEIPIISNEVYTWLLDHKIFPVSFTNDELTVAIENPEDPDLRLEAIKRIGQPVKFMISPTYL
jgi:adsorption protein B